MANIHIITKPVVSDSTTDSRTRLFCSAPDLLFLQAINRKEGGVHSITASWSIDEFEEKRDEYEARGPIDFFIIGLRGGPFFCLYELREKDDLAERYAETPVLVLLEENQNLFLWEKMEKGVTIFRLPEGAKKVGSFFQDPRLSEKMFPLENVIQKILDANTGNWLSELWAPLAGGAKVSVGLDGLARPFKKRFFPDPHL